MLPAFFLAGFVACVIGALLILVLIVHLSTRRYTAAQRYRAFLAGIARQRAQLIRDGHLQETTPGGFSYTAAYHASRAAALSGSGSSSSSSSGGGRSGGGGASSGIGARLAA